MIKKGVIYDGQLCPGDREATAEEIAAWELAKQPAAIEQIRAIENEKEVKDSMVRASRLVALEVAYNKASDDPRMVGKTRAEIEAILIVVDRDFRILKDAESRIKKLRVV